MLTILAVACHSSDDGGDTSALHHSAGHSATSHTTPTDATAHTGGPADTAVCVGGCDDGLDCTSDTCDPARGRCVYAPVTDCPWPASAPSAAVSLVGADPDLEVSLSGAAWAQGDLWLVRNSGPSGVWRLHELGGTWQVLLDGRGAPAEWFDVGDAESVTLRDPVGAPTEVMILDEDLSVVAAWDLSDHRSTTVLARWDLSSVAPPVHRLGLEGMTFVPDATLAAEGFVDGEGQLRTSHLGMGGLVFVSHQLGGWVGAFDLAPSGDVWEYVGIYQTARDETSGLELDAGTGRLYLWHGGRYNDLEVARLSSVPLKDPGRRRFDTEAVFDHPGRGNMEGVALAGVDTCAGGLRSLFLVEDEGADRSIAEYPDWPLGCPPANR